MLDLRLRRLSSPGIATSLSPVLLRRFLDMHGTEAAISNGHASLEAALEAAARIPALAHDLYLVDEMATETRMDALICAVRAAGREDLLERIGYDASPAEFAMQLCVADRQFLERKHAELAARRKRKYHYFEPGPGRPGFAHDITCTTRRAALEAAMSECFATFRRGQVCQVLATSLGENLQFIIRRGRAVRRDTALADDGGTRPVAYRPAQHDVIKLDPRSGLLAVNTELRFVDAYRRVIGHIYADDEECFRPLSRYTLQPLSDGPDALACLDVDGLDEVRLESAEIDVGHGGVVVAKAMDIFAHPLLSQLQVPYPVTSASFDVKFSGGGNRKLQIMPPGIAVYTRDADAGPLEDWMARRGFFRA